MEAGYKKILIAPFPGGPLTWAKAKYESPYGLIISNWKIENGEFIHKVQVPPNTASLIELPAKEGTQIYVNGETITEFSGISIISRSEKLISLAAQPGKYEFRFKF